MKFIGALVVLAASPAAAFISSRKLAMAPRAAATSALPRIVEDPLPKLYVYDHCPFCVRSRLAVGLKNIKHEVVFMANDESITTKLVGKKVAPVLQMVADDVVMNESLDICAYFDLNPRFGPPLFKPDSGRQDLKAWQKALQPTMRCLTRPRYMQTCLPEFMQQDGKDAFVNKHPLPPYEKAEWQTLALPAKWALYDAELAHTPKHLVVLNAALAELEPLIHCETCCTAGGVSYDDVDLWARLRSLTLIKGAVWGPKARAYLVHFEQAGDVPLYFNMQV